MKNSNKIKIRVFSKQKFIIELTFIVLIFVTVVAVLRFNFPKTGLYKALADFFNYAVKMFFLPKLSGMYSFKELVYSLFVTLSLAILTTTFGIVFAFFLSLGAAENISNKYFSIIIRSVMSFIRAVPTIIWVLIFSNILSIGAEAAIIGMSFHSTAYLVKGFSESFEQIDKKTIEALKACGAGYSEIITQAIIPVSINQLISWSFFRFEINFANAVALGAAAGAGGIGYELFIAGSLNFNMKEVGIISYMIFIVSVILEILSSKIRNRLRLH